MKNDEFYTRRADIEAELQHYRLHFCGKVVYCNCDDPGTSEFWKFFSDNFGEWGIKKLIATHYLPEQQAYAHIKDAADREPYAVKISGDGDFRSEACINLLRKSDIVVSNPPFSTWRNYIGQLVSSGKQFLIIGSMNAITYKDFFPLLKDNKVWLGYGHPKTFIKPDGSTQTFGNILWYTNMDVEKRHRELVLVEKYSPDKYRKYDNYDAIEVPRASLIPCDYAGIMGVPITFLSKYNPEQFELVGLDICAVPKQYLISGRMAINGRRKYARILIRNRRKTT